MSSQVSQFYDFGPFRIDVEQRLLLCDGKLVPLTPKVFDTLLLLVENNGKVLDKKKCLDALWPDSFVEEGSLTQNVSLLRKLLGEGQDGQRYIETLPKRGYRFVADVKAVSSENSDLVVKLRTTTHVVTTEEEVSDETQPELAEGTHALLPSGDREALVPAVDIPQSLVRRRPLRMLSRVLLLLTPAVILVGFLYFWSRNSPQPTSPAEVHSIAILPFKEIGVTENQSILGQGMADALIIKFSNLRSVVVRPTSSVLKYADPNRDALKAGRELGVETVLEGSIQQADKRLRLSVQLLRVTDGAALWAEKFDTQLTDMFAVQDAISAQVANALSLQLSKAERDRLRKRYTENTEAYGAYLKGRYLWSKRTAEALKGATGHFEEAIRIDSTYALAYSGLADCYHMNALYGSVPGQEMYPKAAAMAKKALELDDTLAEAHSSLADIKHEFEWDFPGAEKEYKRAIELNPNYPTGRQWYAQYLSNMGRHEEAIAEINRAMALDPTALVISGAAGDILSNAGRHDDALSQLQKTLQIDPNYALTYAFLARVYERKGMYPEALDALQKGWTLDYSEKALKVIAARREALRANGEQGYWRRLLELEAELGGLDPVVKADVLARLGDDEGALESLERASRERSPGIARIKIEPGFQRLRNNPRFKDLLRRVGFPE